MPVDTDKTKPVLIHVNPKDWAEFRKLAGSRRASMRVRALIRRELAQAQRTS
jgi:hypothetical protein